MIYFCVYDHMLLCNIAIRVCTKTIHNKVIIFSQYLQCIKMTTIKQ